MTRRVAIAWATASAWLASAAVAARAQPIDPERPTTITIGVPGGSRTDRVDVARTGFSRTPLPSSGLHTEWRTATSIVVEHAPIVDARGTTYVVGIRGEAVAIARDGTERWRVPTGAADLGPAALLSDDTLVVVDGAGDAIGVRLGAVRWRAHVGGPDSAHVGPLPLDDGGLVVTAGHDLATLDAGGRERARTVVPEPAVAPLLWAAGRVVLVAASGAVWTWAPGATEPSRVGSFGSPTEGGIALAGDHTLVGVVARQTSIAALDLFGEERPAVVRDVTPPGSLWLGPPAVRGDTATVALLGPTSEFAVAADRSGREIGGALLASHPLLSRADAGAPPGAGLMAPLLIDSAGTVVFSTFDGGVGAAALRADALGSAGHSGALATAGAFEVLADACPPPAGGILALLNAAPPSVAGMAPLSPGSLVVVCHSGTVVAIQGGAATAAGGKLRPSTL
jgi:hypothetical protein